MPFSIIRNDITRVRADAIVNTANPHAVIGAGTDAAIYQAAGEKRLLAARQKIGHIPAGSAAVTPAFKLRAKYIIHTVGPAWQGGGYGESAVLASCYKESLTLARKLGCKSIAFPLISAGIYGFPHDLAIRTAASVFYEFLLENDMTILLVVFNQKAFELSGKLFPDVKSFIDDHYAADKSLEEYGGYGAENRPEDRMYRQAQQRRRLDALQDYAEDDSLAAPPAPRALQPEPRGSVQAAQTAPKEPWFKRAVHSAANSKSTASQEAPDLFAPTADTFQEHLLKLIAVRDMKNSRAYNGANITKQHFSKIMSNRHYNPSKNTACALAVSLGLDLEETDALLKTAGFALSDSSRFDLAVKYFIINRMYNIIEDNIILDDNGLESLGTQ